MRKIEPEFITGMGYIGASPGVLYRMGAGETVVTGNPALLEGVKGNRFTSLTLHGKSSQKNTTGAQLFDASLLKNTSSASVECNGNDIIITALDDGPYRQTSSVPIGFFEEGDQICIAAEAFPKDNVVIIRDSSGATITNVIISNGVQEVVTIPANGTYRIILCINKGVSVKAGTVGVFSKLIVNKGNVSKDYEPYTGGKPSPSPEYPQEIENAGQSGEIEVDVYGGNLFDKSTAIFGGVVDKNNGNIARNERYACSDYIAIPRGISFLYQTGGALNQRAFYDAGKIYISAAENANKTNIPTNARYIRITSAIDKQDMSDIMLNIGSTALPYELYKPAQTLIIPTPNGLPGIRVSSGGNYTDADGKQWVCDEVDFKKGVYVQRVATETPKAQWSSFGETADVPNRYRITGALINKYRSCSDKCLISHGIYTDWGASPGWTLNAGAFYYHPEEDVTKEEVKEQILGFINSANPLTFLGQLETPIEIPLTTEQLAAYKALRTYSPTTTVINDAGAGMSAGYRRK